MKTLLFCQCHIRNEWQGRLMATSIALAERLNPGVDILLIDNASFLPPEGWLQWPRVDLAPDGAPVPIPSPRAIAGFGEAIGHFHYDKTNAVAPQDGPGRAIMTALKIAAASGYDRAAYMETDSLCSLPLSWGFDQMSKPTAAMPRISHGYTDYQVWWIKDLQWFVRDFDFPSRYDWPNQKPDWLGGIVGELQYEQIIGEHQEVLPIRGNRGDAMQLVDGTMRERFHEVSGSITHVCPADFETWLELTGHADLIPMLRA